MIKELLIEPIQFLEQIAAEHYAASRLPVDFALRIAFPAQVPVGQERRKQMRYGPYVQRSQQRTLQGRERPRGFLIRPVRIQHSASKRASLRMLLRKFNPTVEGTIVADGIRIQDQDVFAD